MVPRPYIDFFDFDGIYAHVGQEFPEECAPRGLIEVFFHSLQITQYIMKGHCGGVGVKWGELLIWRVFQHAQEHV